MLDATLALHDDTKDMPALLRKFSQLPAVPQVAGEHKTEVTAEKVQDAALRYRGKRVTILNFANGTRPGGGVRSGAVAQEGDLCIASGLLPTLESPAVGEHYAANKHGGSPPEYENQLIVSLNVPMYRDGYGRLVDPYNVTVITCAAPNSNNSSVTPAAAIEALHIRTAHIVNAAAKVNTEVLVLGAWGCGVFGNEPSLVAALWADAVPRYGGPALQQVVHPIYGGGTNLPAFDLAQAVSDGTADDDIILEQAPAPAPPSVVLTPPSVVLGTGTPESALVRPRTNFDVTFLPDSLRPGKKVH